MRSIYLRAVWLVLLASGVTACGTSPPTRYYLLTADAPRSPAAAISRGTTVGIGPIILPRYLERPELMTRAGSNALDVAIYHQWAEPLEDNISRVLEEDLGRRLGTERIIRLPVKRSLRASLTVNYQVPLAVTAFEKTASGGTMLDARWAVLDNDGKELLLRRSEYTATPADDSYDAQVTAQSVLLGRLGEEIAAAIVVLDRGKSN